MNQHGQDKIPGTGHKNKIQTAANGGFKTVC
jgi:hypothetical protein